MAIKQITTHEGDRWDNIASREYGDVSRMNEIRRANPDVPTYYVFPAGVYINVPILEDNNKVPAPESKPPWK